MKWKYAIGLDMSIEFFENLIGLENGHIVGIDYNIFRGTLFVRIEADTSEIEWMGGNLKLPKTVEGQEVQCHQCRSM